jgi:HlyD family secretion protein
MMKLFSLCLGLTFCLGICIALPVARGQADLPLVEVQYVESRSVRVPQTFVGTVLPLRTAVVGSAVDGRVVDFPIREGDRVEQGQTLASLLTATIKLEREAAQGELELRLAELEELENGTREEELEQARARMEAARAAMEYQQARRERIERLYRMQENVTRQAPAATEEEFQEVVAASARTREEYADAAAAYALAVQGPRREQIAQAKARVSMQRALVDRLDEQIDRHTIISRFPGYISMQHTEEGAWVNRGDLIAEVVDLDEVEIEIHIPEERISQVRLHDDRLTIEIPAVPRFDFSGRSAARIEAIVPQADVRSRTFRVKVRLKNQIHEGTQQPQIKAGMLARVTLPVGEEEGLVVPKDSLVLGGVDPVLLVVAPESIESYQDPRTGRDMSKGVVHRIPVRLGAEDGTGITVVSLDGELKDGMFVISKGNERVRPGTPDNPALVRWVAETPIAAR